MQMSRNMMIAILALLVIVGALMYANTRDVADDTMLEDGTMQNDQIVAEDDAMMADDATVTPSDTEMVEDDDSAETITIQLAADPGSTKQTGTATLTEKGDQVEVVVKVSPVMTDPQPAHIHMGACPKPGDVAYPLTNVVSGSSTTMLNVKMADLLAKKPLALNIHKSADEASVYTACGNL